MIINRCTLNGVSLKKKMFACLIVVEIGTCTTQLGVGARRSTVARAGLPQKFGSRGLSEDRTAKGGDL